MTGLYEPPEDWLSVESFHFSRLGEQWAVVRLLARLEAEIDSPRVRGLTTGEARLNIDRGDLQHWSRHLARACRLERRLAATAGPRGHRAGPALLWRASFAVPLAFVQAREAVFELTAGDHLALALPTPEVRLARPRPLSLANREQPVTPHVTVAQARQRVAALATVAALTATSSPGVALAAGAVGSASSSKVAGGTGGGKSGLALDSRRPAGTKVSAGPHRPTRRTGSEGAAPKASGTTTTTVTAPSTTIPAPQKPATTQTTTVPAPTTTTTTTVPAPTPTTTTPARPQRPMVPRPVPGCHSHTRGDLLVITAARHSRFAKRTVGLSVRPSHNCTPTPGPKPGHKHPTSTHPRHGAHPRPGRPGAGHRHHKRATGGAPLMPTGHRGSHARQPKHTPGSSAPSSGGAPITPVPTLSPSPSGFLAPAAWTGTVTADPSLTGAVRNLSGLLTNGNRPPSFLIPIYMQAGKRYDIPWPVLAAINAIESDYGRNLSTSSAGAVGWMQFEPSTWREYGVAADGHSVPNPYDPRDAIFAAARYLKAAGGSHDISRAVFAYNHAGWYVNEVMSRARAIAHHVQYARAKRNKRGTFSVFFATGVKWHPTVHYSGGLMWHYTRLIAAANMVSAANFPYLYGGGHEQPARWGPFDCSGAVSYVLQQAGYKVPTTVSGDVPSWKFPSGPGRVTIFYNPAHTFMRIGNRYFGTSGFARPGGGAGWFNVDKLPAGYLSTFRVVHVPRLGVNSFAPTKLRRTAPAKRRHPAIKRRHPAPQPRHHAPANRWHAPAVLSPHFPAAH